VSGAGKHSAEESMRGVELWERLEKCIVPGLRAHNAGLNVQNRVQVFDLTAFLERVDEDMKNVLLRAQHVICKRCKGISGSSDGSSVSNSSKQEVSVRTAV
jgi:hypothetical protein